MFNNIITVNNALTLKDITDNDPTIILFWRDGCISSQKMRDMLIDVANINPNIICVQVNLQQTPRLGDRFNVRVAPTFIAFSKGKEVNRGCGYLQFQDFLLERDKYV